MSDDDFWDIDQYLTTRRNREIGSDRVVDPVRPASDIRALDTSTERVDPVVGRDLPDRRRRQPRQPRDIAEIHGLDETQLDGNIRLALADMVQEIGMLHGDLRMAEGRIHYLEEELRHDVLGDWLDRKGFLGRLSRLRTLDEREETHSSLLLVKLEGFAEMRGQHGWSAADAVVADLGGRLTQIPNAVVGHVADNMFGVLLVGVSLDSVDTAIGESVPDRIRVPGAAPDLTVISTAVQVRPGQGELDQLSAAERRLARPSGPARR